jgi:hypothetical protein
MIYPRLGFRNAIALVCVGLLVLGWAWSMGGAHEPSPVRFALTSGALICVIGVVWALNSAFAARVMRRLERGEGVVGRWRLDATTLAAFASAEALQKGAARSLWRPGPSEARGAEVIVGESAIVVGEALFPLPASLVHRLESARFALGETPSIEIVSATLTGRPGAYVTQRRTLRIPVPPGADVEAARALGRLQGLQAGRQTAIPSYWRTRMRLGLAICVCSALAAAWGWLRGSSPTLWGGEDLTAGLQIGGLLGLLGGAILASVALVRERAKPPA